MTGRIFDIQRFCLHDGPGIRTTVFLKGCPLRCAWCHNPEGIDREFHLSFLPEQCFGCGYCLKACSRGVHLMEDGKHRMDRGRCVACGACAEQCRAGALKIIGRDVTVEEVMREVRADRSFYETSGGGMTLSGGEPLFQIDFTAALLEEAKQEALHCCVETCGLADYSRLGRVAQMVDLFLYDVKDTDNGRHLANTGVPNTLILENLRRLHDAGAKIILRLPVVPGYNAFDDHLAGIADLAGHLPHLLGAEIIPYHLLGTGKRIRLGGSITSSTTLRPPDERMVAAWVSYLRQRGVRVLDTL